MSKNEEEKKVAEKIYQHEEQAAQKREANRDQEFRAVQKKKAAPKKGS